MSIENNLASIAASLVTIAEALKSRTPNDTRQAVAPVAAPAPVGNVQPATTPSAPVTAIPVVPVAPATPATASPSSCPITDQPSLIAYVMTSYKDMGPVKGNQIQGVLATLGITNINEAKPEQYAAIHAGVEALKAQ